MDVQGGWFGFQKVLTQKGGKVWSGLGLFLVGHTYGWWVETPGYIFQIGVSKHEALGLSLDLAWTWKDEKHMMASLKVV